MLNIGIHLFDLLLQEFGNPQSYKVHYSDWNKAAGQIVWKDGTIIDWLITIDPDDCPTGKPVRKIHFGVEFATLKSPGYCLHEMVYKEILAGRGYTFEDAVGALEMVYEMGENK